MQQQEQVYTTTSRQSICYHITTFVVLPFFSNFICHWQTLLGFTRSGLRECSETCPLGRDSAISLLIILYSFRLFICLLWSFVLTFFLTLLLHSTSNPLFYYYIIFHYVADFSQSFLPHRLGYYLQQNPTRRLLAHNLNTYF